MVNNHCPSFIYFNSEQNSTDCKGLWYRRSGIDRLWTCRKEFECDKQVATTSGICCVSLKDAFDWWYFVIRIYRNMWQISSIWPGALFSKGPGNFSSPKANFKPKTCWKVAQFLANKQLNFASLTNSFIFNNLWLKLWCRIPTRQI